MKRLDIKTGVVYQYSQGRYTVAALSGPVMVLDTSTFWRRAPYGSGWARSDGQARPYAEPVELQGGRPRMGWVADENRGLLSVGFQWRGDLSQRGKHEPPVDLLKGITLDRVKEKPHVKSWAIPGNDNWCVSLGLLNPRFFVGEYYEAKQAEEDEKERRRIIVAGLQAESDQRVVDTQARIDRLRSLGLGSFKDASEDRREHYGTNWEPPTFSGNTGKVTLTLAQVDALLSLIPPGVRYEPDEPNVADDGFSYVHPEGVQSIP